MSGRKKEVNLGIVLDPLSSLNAKKDSTLSIIEAAQKRGWNVFTMTLDDLFVEGALPMAHTQKVKIDRKKTPFFSVQKQQIQKLESFDIILMRKDPPFNIEYIYASEILHLIDPKKTLVSNHPGSLQIYNEKFLINYAPKRIAPTLFTRNHEQMRSFIKKNGKVVVKPMDFMGGKGVFLIDPKDTNREVILETLTEGFTKTIVIQKYLPEISKGDRRVLVIGGEAIPHVMVRKPSPDDHRGNLAAGATAEFSKITETEKKIVQELKPFFIKHGLHLVGLDLIGPYITEINITSPTGIVHLDHHFGISVGGLYLDYLETLLP